jgi:Family of unknown function (DUF5519)
MTRSSEVPFRSLVNWVLQLPRVTQVPHKLGGIEFRVNGRGFMHSHGSSLLDIRLSQDDQALVLSEGRAQHHRAEVHHNEGWVSFRIENEKDVERAKELVRLAYDNAKKEPRLTESQENKL